MKDEKFDVCVIGASNVDIHVEVKEALENDISMIGDISLSAGGVGRNITSSLAALEIYVSFISIFSNDLLSSILLNDLNNTYISLSESIFNAVSTSKYMNLMVENKNYGIIDIKNINEFSISFFKDKLSYLNSMQYVIFDVNMHEQVLKFIINNVKAKLICEATSSLKCGKIRELLNGIYILKANYLEACTIANCERDIDYSELLERILDKGVENIYITLGEKGALYADRNLKIYMKPYKTVASKDTVGAGDTFMAGIVYGEKQNWTGKQILVFSMNLAYHYLEAGMHKLNSKIIMQALNMRDNEVELFYWDKENNKWTEERK